MGYLLPSLGGTLLFQTCEHIYALESAIAQKSIISFPRRTSKVFIFFLNPMIINAIARLTVARKRYLYGMRLTTSSSFHSPQG
jgi:hypothetical protein